MIDRIINLISILCIFVICFITGSTVYNSWKATEDWEKVWVVNEDRKSNPFDKFDNPEQVQERKDPSKILSAMKNAQKAYDFVAVEKLRTHLEFHFRPTDEIKVRISEDEFSNIFLALFASLLSLLIPVSINYVRHAKFRLWNSNST